MRKFLLILWALAVATPLAAQPTHDDCPPDGIKHVALTRTDHASMEAAIVASFVGLYHRQPTGVRGSGPDDITYQIQMYDHYGAYSDGICRAGWNRYAELRLSGDDAPLAKFGDEPATFQPGASPQPPVLVPPVIVPPVVVPPVTPPTPSIDWSGVSDQIAAMASELHAHVLASADEHREILTEARGIKAWLDDHWKSVLGYASVIVTSISSTCKVKTGSFACTP